MRAGEGGIPAVRFERFTGFEQLVLIRAVSLFCGCFDPVDDEALDRDCEALKFSANSTDA